MVQVFFRTKAKCVIFAKTFEGSTIKTIIDFMGGKKCCLTGCFGTGKVISAGILAFCLVCMFCSH